MNSFDEIRVNNIIKDNGPIGHGDYARVESIYKMEDGSGMFSLKKLYEKADLYTSYEKYVRGILLQKNHIETLGFQFNKTSKRYNLNGLIIAEILVFDKIAPGELAGVDLGFRVIPQNFPLLFNKEDVDELTTQILCLHSLQNYCSDFGIDSIDFSLIKY